MLARPAPAAGLALVALLAALAAALLVRANAYDSKALPGVRVLGVDVSGLDRAQIASRVRARAAARLPHPIAIRAAGETISIRGDDVFRVDAKATADAALAAGRDSVWSRATALLPPIERDREITPVLSVRRIRGTQVVKRLDRLGRPALPARVVLRGGNPLVTHGSEGRRVHQRRLFAELERSALAGGAVEAAFRTVPQPVSNAAAAEAAQMARAVLSAPVTLRFRGQELGTLWPSRLARLLRLRVAGGRYVVGLAERPLEHVVRPLLAPWRLQAANARFVIEGDRVRVTPSRPGTDVDVPAVLGAVTAAAYAEADRTADLALRARPADLTTREAKALGIRRLVSTFTTDMGVSSANRIHNVHLMADYIDGTIVRPGETFSFNGVVGPRTTERGFLEGQMIVGSLLLPSIGGGVCQTATTLFNNAFELGLQIVERHNHNLYISHYPLGRDATVAWGGPDFKFRNDMKNALLIKSSYTDSTLTFTFYGTDEGRRVVSTTGPQENFRAPAMTYALDPSAPPGSVRVVGGANRSGFDVTVSRTVYAGGRPLRRDAFKSTYIPEGPTRIYGPGRTPPSPYFVIPAY